AARPCGCCRSTRADSAPSARRPAASPPAACRAAPRRGGPAVAPAGCRARPPASPSLWPAPPCPARRSSSAALRRAPRQLADRLCVAPREAALGGALPRQPLEAQVLAGRQRDGARRGQAQPENVLEIVRHAVRVAMAPVRIDL